MNETAPVGPLGPDRTSPIERLRAFVQTLTPEARALAWQRSVRSGYDYNAADDAHVRSLVDHWNQLVSAHTGRLERAEEWVRAGLVTREEVFKLTIPELEDVERLARTDDAAMRKRSVSLKLASLDLAARPHSAERPVQLEQVMAMFSQAVVVIATLQTEVEQLRTELAETRDASLALFGENKVLEQVKDIVRTGVAVEGLESEVSIIEGRDASESVDASAKREAHHAEENAYSGAVRIKGLARFVAGLDLTGKVDLSEMNRTIEEMEQKIASRTREHKHARVSIKIKRITPRSPPGTDSTE